MSAAFFGRFFDGRSSMPVPVAMRFEARTLVLVAPDFERRVEHGAFEMPERTDNGQPILRIRGGALVEVDDVGALWQAAREAGIREPLVARMQQRWSLSLAAVALTVLALFAGYRWGLPWVAEHVAPALPRAIETSLDRQALEWLDDEVLSASALPEPRRESLDRRFGAMVARANPDGAPAPWRLVFRAGGEIGANAFALPGGTIVVTDELASIADDDALLGVLAHEYGHVARRHLMRRVLQVAALGATASALWGDFSGLAVAVPTVLGGLDYSRDLEREADREAVRMLQAADVPVEPLIGLFARIERIEGDTPSDGVDGPDDGEAAGAGDGEPTASLIERYLSSHPLTRERIEALRHAAAPRARVSRGGAP